MRQISLEIGLIRPETVRDWVKKYKNDGEQSIITTYGRKNYELEEEKKNRIANDDLLERLEYLEAENAALKKYVALTQEKKK